MPDTKKMVPFKKILSQIINGLHTNHFCSMGAIIKFVINMEVLDAELERIYNRLSCFCPSLVYQQIITLSSPMYDGEFDHGGGGGG